MTTTINISLPTAMYAKAKKSVKEGRYQSISEIFREGLRYILKKDEITVNGFTKEFEDAVLESAKEPLSLSKEWTSTQMHAYFAQLRKKRDNGQSKKIR